MLLFCSLLAMLLPALAEPVPEAVIGNTWRNEYGTLFTFSQNGTGVMHNTDGTSYDLSYTYENGLLEYHYSVKVEMFGTKVDYKLNKTLQYAEEDGIPSLSNLGDRKGTAVASLLPVDLYDQIKAQYDAILAPYEADFGEEIDLGFMRFTITKIRSQLDVISKNGGTGAASVGGKRYICLVGSVENTGTDELDLSKIAGCLLLDGEREFTGVSGSVETADGMASILAPAGKGTLFVYIHVPELQASSFSSAAFVIAMNDTLKSSPAFAGAGDFSFKYQVSGKEAEEAAKLPEKEIAWFKESPALVRPDSFLDLRQSYTSTSSSNGKTTRISYTFTPKTAVSALEMLNTYADKLKEYGYTVQLSGGTLKISYQSKFLATVTVESDNLKFDITPGNEKMKQPEKPKEKKQFNFGK